MRCIFLWLLGVFCVLNNGEIHAELIQPSDCLKSYETDDCWISFVVDTSGNKFVVKQVKDPSPDEQFLLVLDAMGCHIAEQISVPMNRVIIIPAAVSCVGKKRADLPATLHTMALGICTEEEGCVYHDIDLHQRFRKKNTPMWEKWGPLPPEAIGLTLNVIQNMAKHSDLPKIVALDTFVGNADRSAPNLFYHIETDRFCGIDMAASFNTDLAKEAYLQIQQMEMTDISLSKLEKDALKEYTYTLEILLKNYSSEIQESLLKKYAEMAGFQEGSSLWNEEVQERIEFHKRRIRSNVEYSKKLVSLLYQVLGREFS